MGESAVKVVGLLAGFGLLLVSVLSLGSIVFHWSGWPTADEWSVLVFTLKQAALSALFSITIAFGFSEIFARFGKPQSYPWVYGALVATFGIPAMSAIMAMIELFGNHGIIGGLFPWGSAFLYGLVGIVLAHGLLNIPWASALLWESRSSVRPEFFDVARTLGASGGARLRWILWPGMKSQIFSVFSQIFFVSLGSFSIVLILGGGPPIDTWETKIYTALRYGNIDLGTAARMSVLQFIVILPLWFFLFHRPLKTIAAEIREARAISISRFGGLVVVSLSGFLLSPFLIGLFIPIWRSLDFSILPTILVSFAKSVQFALPVSILGTLIGFFLLLAKMRSSDRSVINKLVAFASFAGIISNIVFCFGFWIAFGRFGDLFNLETAIFVQTLLSIPLALRTLAPIVLSPRGDLISVARTLGATDFMAYRKVEWPRVRGACLATFSLIFSVGLGEVAVLAFFGPEGDAPLALQVLRWMGQYQFQAAGLGSAVLFISCIIINSLVMRILCYEPKQ